MKKLIVVSTIMALTLLMGSFFALAQPQDTANEEKPTFYRLVPGTYVNGWPRFTITYPKDWIERRPVIQEVFAVVVPGPFPRVGFSVAPYSGPLSLDKLSDLLVPFYRIIAKDVILVSDKPSRLQDGTPAREVEVHMVMNGVPFQTLVVATKKGDLQINTHLTWPSGKIGEGLRTILYSLWYQPGKDEPVKVPPDVQKFLDSWCNEKVSHDVAKVMTHYSDRYVNSGDTKGVVEQFQRQYISLVTSFEVGITDFVPAGDRAYLAGFENVNGAKYILRETSIIKESGEWKWYGNQRNPSP
jgi:hypothetical protein